MIVQGLKSGNIRIAKGPLFIICRGGIFGKRIVQYKEPFIFDLFTIKSNFSILFIVAGIAPGYRYKTKNYHHRLNGPLYNFKKEDDAIIFHIGIN